MHELVLIVCISVFAGLVTHARNRITRIIGSIVIGQLVLLVYFLLGVYINNEYETEMMIGWFIFSIGANLLVVPFSYLFGSLILKSKVWLQSAP